MSRYRDEPPAIRVYTVCDESRYLIVRNVPALGCGDDLMRLFSTYGDVEECKPMDAEECEPFTDVYWIKFRLISNARFAKKKLDESVLMGNKLQVSYAPQFESLEDTKDKLEGRRKEILARLNPHKSMDRQVPQWVGSRDSAFDPILMPYDNISHQSTPRQRIHGEVQYGSFTQDAPITRVSSDKEYFTSPSMNQTVQMVREKLDKIQERRDQKRLQDNSQHQRVEPVTKRPRIEGRRRI